MISVRDGDTRTALLAAAAELISASPGQDVPLRGICERVGVRLPTLYHYFGSKEGLLEAVVDHGFDTYLAVKASAESSGDPIEDIRNGWDAHVAFGVDNPGFYALMYGKVVPGYRPSAQDRATSILRGLTRAADEQGRLVVPPDQAADHVLAANVGVTLRLIAADGGSTRLSDAVREATLTAITGGPSVTGGASTVRAAAGALLRVLPSSPRILDVPEQTLLKKWLTQLTTKAE